MRSIESPFIQDIVPLSSQLSSLAIIMCIFDDGIFGFELYLRSFVIETKPRPSLNYNLKSVP